MFRISLLSIALSLFSCATFTSETGKDIVYKSIERHGGQKTFQELEAIAFTKTTRLYKEDGSVESETFQKQSFTFIPDYSLIIKWMDGIEEHKISYDGNIVTKLIDNVIVDDQSANENALKLAMSADYVFFQPFKLIDDKGELSYVGKQLVGDSIETSVVAVKYENDTSLSDAWRYYFDEDYRLVAASVKHNNRISLIENLDFQRYKGVLFNKIRKSYFVDSLFQKKQLRAEYHYKLITPSEF